MITSLSIVSVAPLLASKSKSSSGSSSGLSFLIIIVLLVAVYFFFLRPRQQRAKVQAAKGKSFGIGDEVMSVGGIFGRVVGLGDESVDVEVAPGVVMTFLKRAVNPRPASALSDTAPRSNLGSGRDDPAHPFGGSAPDSTSFGASSGHFDVSDEQREAAEEDFEGEGAEEDFEGEGAEEDFEGEGAEEDFEDEGDEDDSAESGVPESGVPEPGVFEEHDGGASDNGHGYGDPVDGDDESADGSATGMPRRTGGSRSEDD